MSSVRSNNAGVTACVGNGAMRMTDDVVALLVAERYRPLPTPSPTPAPHQDTPEVIERRRQVLADMPGDEWPGEEAA